MQSVQNFLSDAFGAHGASGTLSAHGLRGRHLWKLTVGQRHLGGVGGVVGILGSAESPPPPPVILNISHTRLAKEMTHLQQYLNPPKTFHDPDSHLPTLNTLLCMCL